jgi:uncharacterized membrane protein
MQTIRNPIEWLLDQFKGVGRAVGSARHGLHEVREHLHSPPPAVARIGSADLREILAKGYDDFGAYRTDVIFLCVIYPIVGLVLARVAFGEGMLPLLFPLASGFALVGPFAAIGLYEMSRERENGVDVGWANAFGVVRSPALGGIVLLGLLLVVVYLVWLGTAQAIYNATLGPEPPASVAAFVRDVLTTSAGWTMAVVGVGVGFLFAVVAMAIGVVSFPLMLDRNVGLDTALTTSVRAVAANPVPMALWGLIVTGGLVIGSLPLFLGLIIVMPVLGHATWHLYRKLVPR